MKHSYSRNIPKVITIKDFSKVEVNTFKRYYLKIKLNSIYKFKGQTAIIHVYKNGDYILRMSDNIQTSNFVFRGHEGENETTIFDRVINKINLFLFKYAQYLQLSFNKRITN